MSLPTIFESPEQGASELGEAMHHLAFRHILDLLEGYEQRILTVGIEDPEQTKDFMRGAVHAARSMRSSLLAAKEHFDAQMQKELMAQKRKREFLPPGSGSGDLS